MTHGGRRPGDRRVRVARAEQQTIIVKQPRRAGRRPDAALSLLLLFVVLITAGTGLLMLPFATADGASPPVHGCPLHRHQRRLRHRPGGGGHGDLLEPVRPGRDPPAHPDRRLRHHGGLDPPAHAVPRSADDAAGPPRGPGVARGPRAGDGDDRPETHRDLHHRGRGRRSDHPVHRLHGRSGGRAAMASDGHLVGHLPLDLGLQQRGLRHHRRLPQPHPVRGRLGRPCSPSG